MAKIISLTQAKEQAKKIHQNHQTIALTGGCFDILHLGHLALFQTAKKSADTVFVLLESDTRIAALKGHHKPINTQKERALMLANIEPIDYVVLLPFLSEDNSYDKIVQDIHPETIIITKGDSLLAHKQKQANLVGAQIVTTPLIKNKSTSKIAQILSEEL